MVHRQNVLSLTSSRDYCQRFSPLKISDTPRAGFQPAQNLSSDFVKESSAVAITTTPERRNVLCNVLYELLYEYLKGNKTNFKDLANSKLILC